MLEPQVRDLKDVLGQVEKTANGHSGKVRVGEMVEAFGPRSFGPVLLLAGLLGMTPVAAVPAAPSTLALITVLVASQLLLGRRTIWLPRFLTRLSVTSGRLHKAVRVARKPADVVDRAVRPRLHQLTGGLADRIVAGVCILVALTVPPLEFVPLAAAIPSLAIFAFGLGLVTRDGLVVLAALLVSGSAAGLIVWRLLAA